MTATVVPPSSGRMRLLGRDAASDKPVPFVPDCTSGPGGFQVCIHPAFSGYLSEVAAGLDPVAAEIAGLPGAPVRAEQVASAGTGPGGFEPSYIAGNPPVFEYNGEQVGDLFGGFMGIPAGAGAFWRAAFQQGLLDSFLAEPPHSAAAARTGPAPLGAAQQAVEDALMIAAGSQPPPGAAAAIAVTSHSPFGEPERATGRWLPCLRFGTALALTAVAIGLLQLAVTGAGLNEGILVMARNVIGMTGIGLLTSLVTGGLLAWTLPLGYMAFAQYALLEAWRSPWTWPARPPTDRGAWICASVVFAVGLAAFTIRGARDRLADNA